MNRNYSKELEKILKNPENRGKRLFLHSCCAPCSSYVLEYLRTFFRCCLEIRLKFFFFQSFILLRIFSFFQAIMDFFISLIHEFRNWVKKEMF